MIVISFLIPKSTLEFYYLKLIKHVQPGTRSTINSSIKINRPSEYWDIAAKMSLARHINFVSTTLARSLHELTTVKLETRTELVEKKELCVVWNLCKFAFKVIKLIQVFSFSVLCLRLPTLQFWCLQPETCLRADFLKPHVGPHSFWNFPRQSSLRLPETKK